MLLHTYIFRKNQEPVIISHTKTLLNAHTVDPSSEKVLGIETVWGKLKANVDQRLRPVVTYCDQLKVPSSVYSCPSLLDSDTNDLLQLVVSPSVRQCLDIYEQPTTRDRFTGKVRARLQL